MASKKKQTFIVTKHPYNHPNEDGLVPVGAEVYLDHLTPAEIMHKIALGQVKAVGGDYIPPKPKPAPPAPPRLNKYGKPYGQAKKDIKEK